MAPRRILILGSTGQSGLIFIHDLLDLASPPELVLYVRSASKLSDEIKQSKYVRVIQGSLEDEAALVQAMKDVEVVVSFLGAYPTLGNFFSRSTATPIADTYPNVIKAMKANHIKRILALATTSTVVPGEKVSWSWTIAGAIPPLVLPAGAAEMRAVPKHFADPAHDLDYTIFRVPFLNDLSADLPVQAGLLGVEGHTESKHLSRASMVRWLWQEIEEGEWIRGMPALANP